METVRFRKSGGPIVAEITCGHAQEGAYTLFLWEKDSNSIVMEKKGNFLNPEDDAYELPRPVKQNDGRLLECLTTVVVTPPIHKFAVFLKISQDGKKLGVVSASGESDQPAVTVDLFARLVTERA